MANGRAAALWPYLPCRPSLHGNHASRKSAKARNPAARSANRTAISFVPGARGATARRRLLACGGKKPILTKSTPVEAISSALTRIVSGSIGRSPQTALVARRPAMEVTVCRMSRSPRRPTRRAVGFFRSMMSAPPEMAISASAAGNAGKHPGHLSAASPAQAAPDSRLDTRQFDRLRTPDASGSLRKSQRAVMLVATVPAASASAADIWPSTSTPSRKCCSGGPCDPERWVRSSRAPKTTHLAFRLWAMVCVRRSMKSIGAKHSRV